MGIIQEGASGAKEYAFEKFIKDIPLTRIDGASLEEGKQLSKSRWDLAGNHFFSVFHETQDSIKKAKAGIELSQMLINVNRYGQAKRFLQRTSEDVAEMEDGFDKDYLEAKILEKHAWIDGYEGRSLNQLENLREAEEKLVKIPPELWQEDHVNLLSTITHFSARAYYGLAIQTVGQVRLEFLSKSLSLLRGEATRLEDERVSGRPQYLNEAYQHAWIARCNLMIPGEEYLKESESEALKMRALFQKELEENPESVGMGQYYMLLGAILIKKDKPALADKSFNKAYKIFTEAKVPYIRGAAEALTGKAVGSLYTGMFGEYEFYRYEAARTLVFGA